MSQSSVSREGRRGTDPAGPADSLETTSFIGRQRELHDLSALLDSGVALLSIVGPAGVGKTRVARRLLSHRRGLGETGFFCDLRAARTTTELCEEVARTLGIHLDDTSSDSLVEGIGQALSALRDGTLVLDNYEHLVLAADPSPLPRWRQCASSMRLVVTSRRRLRFPEERTYELEPLPLPEHERHQDCESARLFVERAEAAEPALRGALDFREHVRPIVTLLEGMPLAIELAAGLMRRASPTEALESLQKSQLSLRATRTTDPRHVSLRTAIESSWATLTPREREAVIGLSVFREGFTLEGAQAVLERPSYAAPADVFEAIDGLRDASILRVVPGHGTKRWDFFEATREYAAEQPALASPDGSARRRLRDRHARFMAGSGRRYLADLATQKGLSARRGLRLERANLQVAYEWGVSEGDRKLLPPLALSFDAAIRETTPGRSVEILDEALGKCGPLSDIERAELVTAKATSQRILGRLGQAKESLEEAEALVVGRASLGATLELERGRLRLTEGDAEAARESLEQALRLAEKAESPALEGRVRGWLAALHAEYLHDPGAFHHYEQAIELLEAAGDDYTATATRGAWSFHRLLARQPVLVDEFERQLELAQRFGNRWEEVRAALGIAIVTFEAGDVSAALDRLEHATQVARASGLRYAVACCRMWTGILLDETGEWTQAAFHYSQAIESAHSIGSFHVEAMSGVYYGALVARRGTIREARALLSHSIGILEGVGDRCAPLLSSLQSCRLDVAEAQTLRRQGALKRSAALVRKAKRRYEVLQNDAGADRAPLLPKLFHGALIDRMLRGDLQRVEAVHPTLRVWNDGSAFQIGERPAVSIGRGVVIRRVLTALRHERVEKPGESLTVEALLAVGWPGQSMHPASGVERIKTVIKRLRRAGLKDILRTEDGGYLLDPAVPVEDVRSREV